AGGATADALVVAAVALLDGAVVDDVHQGEVARGEVGRGRAHREGGAFLRPVLGEPVGRPAVAGGVATGPDGQHRSAAALDDGGAARGALVTGSAQDDTLGEGDGGRHREGAGGELHHLTGRAGVDGRLDVGSGGERGADGRALGDAVGAEGQPQLAVR